MTDFLTKPLDPEQLVRTLRRHIEQARGQPLHIQPSGAAAAPAAADPYAPLAAPGRWPAAADTAGSWPTIAGINSEEAQTRLGHDQALFLRLLKRLLGEFTHAATPPRRTAGLASPTPRRWWPRCTNCVALLAWCLPRLCSTWSVKPRPLHSWPTPGRRCSA